MTKAELIKKIAAETNLTNEKAESALKATLEIITSELGAGNAVQISGFGRFSVKERKEHTGRNPRTGESLTVPACKTVTFSCAKILKDSVNQ